MIWKPKERELTREEAIDLAKKELKPLWFGTAPLLAGIRSGTKATCHPLDPQFMAARWVITLVDATSFAGQEAIETLTTWCQRYTQLGLHFLLVIHFPRADFFKTASIKHRFEKEMASGLKIAIDHDGTLSLAFGFSGVGSRSVILVNGQPRAETSGSEWGPQTEVLLQNLLRETDPGLPLLPPIASRADETKDLGILAFGTQSKIPEGAITMKGEWLREADRITTADPAATLSFQSPGSQVAFLIQPHDRAGQARLAMEINHLPVYEELYGRGMEMSDEGFTQFPLGTDWFNRPVAALPENFRDITIRFPDAKTVKTVLFGIRFGK